MKTKILYEDNDIIVCYKPAGLATQTNRLGQADVVSELKNYRYQAERKTIKGEPYVGLVHRLDQPVEGVLVIGKTKKAADELSKQIAGHQMQKKYLAVVIGEPKEEETLVDYLYKDAKSNSSSVVPKETKDAKRAELSYRTLIKLPQSTKQAIVEVSLKTGRHHQIRLQMAHAGFPLLGDSKYGSISTESKNVALCAYALIFEHPITKKRMEMKIKPENEVFLPLFGMKEFEK